MVKIEKTRLPAILTDLLFFIMIIIHCRVFGSDTEKKQDIDTNSFRMHFVDTFCAHSKEAKDSGLIKFLAKVRKEYYEQHPFLISTLPNVTREIIRAIYQPYDASPTALKKRTDSSRTLSKQLNNLKITKSKLKIRERRILAQTKYLLQHNFDFPLEDYYSGIWLLGPDYLCESTTCDILTHFRGVLIRFLPRTVEDLELVKHWILKHNSTFNQLEENGRSGVKYGMVQPMEVCRASVDALKSYNSGIGDKGPEGVWDEPIGNIVLSEDFYEDLEDDVVTKWQAKYDNQYPSETLKKALLDGIGKPFQKYLNYLKGEHLKHCVPSTVSSGLSKLPLKNVYTDGRINEEWIHSRKS